MAPILAAGEIPTGSYPLAGSASGYGRSGASWTKNSLATWLPKPGDADADITFNVRALRARSRDLYMSNPLAAGCINTIVNYVIGDGIRVQPNVDWAKLGITEEQGEELNGYLKDCFEIWAENKSCDFNYQNTFYAAQKLTFLSMLLSGDCPVLLPMFERSESPYLLKVRVLEADRVCNPWAWNFEKNILDGVELNERWEMEAVHVRQVHPGAIFYPAATVEHFFEWVRVPIWGEKTGRPNVLWLMEPERPEQRRGVPLLAKVMELLKQTDRFILAEVDAAVISAYFTVFIESEFPQQAMFELFPREVRDDLLTFDRYNVALGSGLINFLRPGSKVNFAKTERPSGQFEPFVRFVAQLVGSACQMPFEILLKQFNASYSASRAAMLDFMRRAGVYASGHTSQFSRPIYEEISTEEAFRGGLNRFGVKPERLGNLIYRRALLRSNWHGKAVGSIDPEKEVKAYHDMLPLGATTGQQIAAELSSSDWDANIERQGKERKKSEKQGIPYPSVSTPATVTQRIEDISQQDPAAGGKGGKGGAPAPGKGSSPKVQPKQTETPQQEKEALQPET